MNSKEILSEVVYEIKKHSLYRPHPKPSYRRTRSSPRSGRVHRIPVELYMKEKNVCIIMKDLHPLL